MYVKVLDMVGCQILQQNSTEVGETLLSLIFHMEVLQNCHEGVQYFMLNHCFDATGTEISEFDQSMQNFCPFLEFQIGVDEHFAEVVLQLHFKHVLVETGVVQAHFQPRSQLLYPFGGDVVSL